MSHDPQTPPAPSTPATPATPPPPTEPGPESGPEPVFRPLCPFLGGLLPLAWFVFTRRVTHWVALLLGLGLILWFGSRHPAVWSELSPPREPPAAAAAPGAPASAAPLAASRYSDWLQRWQACLGLATFTIALLVWFGEAHEDWEESRPKLMTCIFLHDRQPAIICRHVGLAGEGDLRAWAQQVSAQAVGAHLDFHPDLYIPPPRLGRLHAAPGPGWAGCRAWLRRRLTGDDLRQHFVIRFRLRTAPRDPAGIPSSPAAPDQRWFTRGYCWYLNAADPAQPEPRRLSLAELQPHLKKLPEWPELSRSTASCPPASA